KQELARDDPAGVLVCVRITSEIRQPREGDRGGGLVTQSRVVCGAESGPTHTRAGGEESADDGPVPADQFAVAAVMGDGPGRLQKMAIEHDGIREVVS